MSQCIFKVSILKMSFELRLGCKCTMVDIFNFLDFFLLVAGSVLKLVFSI